MQLIRIGKRFIDLDKLIEAVDWNKETGSRGAGPHDDLLLTFGDYPGSGIVLEGDEATAMRAYLASLVAADLNQTEDTR